MPRDRLPFRLAPMLASLLLLASVSFAELRPLESLSRTGVIYDRVLPLAHLERLDGGPDAPVVTAATWRQACDELRRASLGAPAGPDPAALDAVARAARRQGVIPIAVLDRAFERVRPEALAEGSVRIEDGRVLADEGALELARAFAAAALVPRTFRGAAVVFTLEPVAFLTDDTTPGAIEIDFADGRGYRRVAAGERVEVGYASTGPRVLAARVSRADGSVAVSRFAFDVASLAAPSPDDTLHVTATVPYGGSFGTGDAYVYLAPGRTELLNPVVVVEGFDLDNSMNWDELYDLLNRENLLETLRADGFDAVVLNFTDATVPVQENAFVVAALIQQVQGMIAPQATLTLVGASMGGLCSRYALAWLESQGLPHRVRTWVSFDAPHEGADIPLGLQYWIRFFATQSAEAAVFQAILERPAARQLLLHHFTSPPGATGNPDPMRAAMLADFAAVGDYPSLPRRIAVANGSGARQNQGFLPGAQVIRWEYTSLFVSISGNVWAVPDQATGTIFHGSYRVVFPTTSQTVTVTGTLPWDGAPGGSRATFTELDAVPAPYGNIIAFHPAHCFVPTVSALALATPDPFFDVAGAPDLLALTPFDAVFFPATNEPHVMITPANAAWVRNEIEQGVLAAPAPSPDGDLRMLAGPNPFSGSTRVSFTLPREESVDLRVFGVDGREVATLLRGQAAPGVHAILWDGRGARGEPAPSGIYFIRLEADGAVRTRRVVRLD